MRKKTIVLVLLLLGSIITQPALATPLADLLAGEPLIVHDKIFTDWEILFLDSLVDPDLSQIEVLPLDNDPLNPGIHYETNGQLFVTGMDALFFDFSYQVATLSGLPLIKDNSLDLTGYSFAGLGGLFDINEFVYDASGQFIDNKNVGWDNLWGVGSLSDSIVFDPVSSLQIVTSISMFGDFPDDFVRIDSFEQRFSQNPVPEPGSLLLLGTGIAGLCGYGRKRKK